MSSHQQVLVDMSQEVQVPISEMFISLALPGERFKSELLDSQTKAEDRAKALAQAEIDLKAAEQQLSGFIAGLEGPVPSLVGPTPPGKIIIVARLKRLTAMRDEAKQRVLRLKTPLFPRLFLVERYNLMSLRTGFGKGPTVGTIPLAPLEKKTVETSISQSQSTAFNSTTTVMESREASATSTLNNHVADASSKGGSTDAVDYHMNANFHGDASVTGFGSGEANAALDVKGGCNTVRNDFSAAVESAVDSQVGQAQTSRQQNVSQQSTDQGSKTDTRVVSRDEVTNPSSTHSVNCFFYQVVERYTSFLSLFDVQIAFRNGDPALDRQVSLTALDQLLDDVLDPSQGSPLSVVLDHKERVINVTEEFTLSPGKTLVRFNRDLQTECPITDDRGNLMETIKVDGVVVAVFNKKVLSKNLVQDLVIGETSIP
jgi:hypothetical protein